MEPVGIICKILGGLALFMFGISMLSDTMKRFAGSRLKQLLEHATANPLKGMAAGATITFLVQSSSVTVLLLLGLVNAGVMKFSQAVYVILGAEIGTTVTAQIVAFKLTLLFFPLLIAGFTLRTLGSASERLRDIGELIFYLGLIFLAMQIMTDGARPLREYSELTDCIVNLGQVPLYGILLGATFTAITSSSSATTSLVIALSMEGVIDLPSGISLIVGANVGTCVLELVAIVGTNISAKRTGMAQFVINLIGVVLIYPVIVPFSHFIAMTTDDIPRQIANAHTIFNIAVSFLIMPFTGWLIYLLERIVPGSERKVSPVSISLDRRLLNIPALALSQAETEVQKMVQITEEMLRLARPGVIEDNQEARKTVRDYEKDIDLMNSRLTAYLGRISTLLLSEEDGRLKRALVHTLTDIERIADLAENLVNYSEQKEFVFSKSALKELDSIFTKTMDAHDAAVRALRRKGRRIDVDQKDIKRQAKLLRAEYRRNYYNRQLQKDHLLTVDAFYPMVLRDLERINGHSLNIVDHFDSL